MSRLPTAQEIADLLDAKPASRAEANAIILERKHRLDDLAPRYVEAFPLLRRYPGRMCILFRLVSYVRQDPAVVELALDALSDSSRIVRYHACAALAYSQSRRVLPKLKALLEHPDGDTRGHAAAAIDAIESQNHHYFADRGHTGKVFWHPGGWHPSGNKSVV
jgi:hypothetical protein